MPTYMTERFQSLFPTEAYKINDTTISITSIQTAWFLCAGYTSKFLWAIFVTTMKLWFQTTKTRASVFCKMHLFWFYLHVIFCLLIYYTSKLSTPIFTHMFFMWQPHFIDIITTNTKHFIPSQLYHICRCCFTNGWNICVLVILILIKRAYHLTKVLLLSTYKFIYFHTTIITIGWLY